MIHTHSNTTQGSEQVHHNCGVENHQACCIILSCHYTAIVFKWNTLVSLPPSLHESSKMVLSKCLSSFSGALWSFCGIFHGPPFPPSLERTNPPLFPAWPHQTPPLINSDKAAAAAVNNPVLCALGDSPPPSPRWFLYLVFVFLLGAICTREALRYDFLIAEKVKSRLFPSCLVGAARSTEGGDSPSWLGLSDHVCSRSRDVGNIAELLFFFFFVINWILQYSIILWFNRQLIFKYVKTTFCSNNPTLLS